MQNISITVCFLCVLGAFIHVQAQQPDLYSGPMVCHSDMREVKVWIQTNLPAECQMEYSDGTAVYRSAIIRTNALQAYTGFLLADSVKPGKQYTYKVFINGNAIQKEYPLQFRTPALWQWRTDPPDLAIALGSCFYANETEYDRPGRSYGGEYQIFNSIAQQKPDLMLWLGDNTYLREPDLGSRTGILHRYTHSRAVKELQPLLGSAHHYAIWDDHDFGPNDSDRGYSMKKATLEAFQLFWGNPISAAADGNYTTFQWSDIQFFLLDNRSYRSPDKRKTGARTILGQAQIEWLMDNLASSTARFKVIAMGGQFVNPLAQYENYSIYPQERKAIIDLLAKENIPGIIILSGDRHYSELAALPKDSTGMNYVLYDFTVSPLTSGPASKMKEEDKNPLRLNGTDYYERNFGMINVQGKGADRTLILSLYDNSGKQLWKKELKAIDLGYSPGK
jgi:alkaline phosphatase D